VTIESDNNSDVSHNCEIYPDSTSLFDVMFTSGRRIFKSVCSSAIRLGRFLSDVK